jgi:tetratricopeptide (TPR) repeat protein
LSFYEEHLPLRRVLLLGIVALFQSPVGEAVIRDLALRLPVIRAAFDDRRGAPIEEDLKRLCLDHLLLRELTHAGAVGFSCHPVLRDHFRATLVSKSHGAAPTIAELLTAAPASHADTQGHERETVLTAIDLLLESGHVREADLLFRTRLVQGQVFLVPPSPVEGLQCALGFVSSARRRRRCETELGSERLAFYLNGAGLFATMAGELEDAARFYAESLELRRDAAGASMHGRKYSCIGLQNTATLMFSLGRLDQARSAAEEAVRLAEASRDDDEQTDSLIHLGAVLTYLGHVDAAARALQRATELATTLAPDDEHSGVYSLGSVRLADALLRLGAPERARRLMIENSRHCAKMSWFDDVALCRWILGRIDLAGGRLRAAMDAFTEAEATLRSERLLEYLPRVLVSMAELFRCRASWAEALRHVDEAARLAAPRRMRIVQADALVLRGLVRLSWARSLGPDAATQARRLVDRAWDDGDAGLRIARGCSYPWAERDALELLGEVSGELGKLEESVAYQLEHHELSARLRPIAALEA